MTHQALPLHFLGFMGVRGNPGNEAKIVSQSYIQCTASMVKSTTRPRSTVATVFTSRVHDKWDAKLTLKSQNTSFIQTTRSILARRGECPIRQLDE